MVNVATQPEYSTSQIPQSIESGPQQAQNNRQLKAVSTPLDFLFPLKRELKRLFTFGITAQGLYGVYQTTIFVLVTLPAIEQQLATGQVTNPEINQLAGTAIIVSLSSAFSLFFAIKLSFSEDSVTRWSSSITSGLFFLFNSYLLAFVSRYPIVEQFGNWLISQL